ncbi:chromosome segregation SMC family protein [Candidatus Pelagibacter sp. RS40]|uniref:chromosome segregation SMC family protein n=1 Tax=Candidatus Pelagibacter sp. RS40 TaxID=1977865 RepID=UPI000A15EE05|nr:AAA family ATPase [Candidatus Pelagibacter sp. RS40]ARJ48840.1 chromosome segregation protein SMC [Candidatus Pelagibacter sp. RS40]
MEFKKIQLTGFKSFAEKTNFLIEEGLTGIVGPNGCGKSNIVESLRWCMGETSAKSMRGSGMEDVIFSGTSNKPSKNIAEVSIALSNENKDGPIQYNDLDEIEIKRKIEKDKGSKFYINNKEVRAKDAQMFFADLSTGAHSPSLISQGRIGALVTAKPADRRAILEEAAGIAGLHVRRHEAELRLSAAENNLKRADELRRQQERQLANLQKQAEEAAKYKSVSEEIKKVEAGLYYLKLKDIDHEIKLENEINTEAEDQVKEFNSQLENLEKRITDETNKVTPIRERNIENLSKIQRLNLELKSLDEENERIEEEIKSIKNSLRMIDEDIDREKSIVIDANSNEKRLKEEKGELIEIDSKYYETEKLSNQDLDVAKENLKREQDKVDRILDTFSSENLKKNIEQINKIIDQITAAKNLINEQNNSAALKVLDECKENLSYLNIKIKDAEEGDKITVLNETNEIIKKLQEKYADIYSNNQNIKKESVKRNERIQKIDLEIESWKNLLTNSEKMVRELNDRKNKQTLKLNDLEKQPQLQAEKKGQISESLRISEKEQNENETIIVEIDDKILKLSNELKDTKENSIEIRERKASSGATIDGLSKRRSDLLERVSAELNLSEEKLLEFSNLEKEVEFPDVVTQEELLDEKKRQREKLGSVNLRADEETSKYEVEIKKMEKDRQDLVTAIIKLKESISELNQKGRERLLEAFEKVNRKFNEVYTKLFNGGNAKLELVDSDDPLDAGLEMLVSPPGKRLQSITLLSGGEQALTALSLIFAVFLTNPSPICVLDEVDAPLDDANVTRFCNLLTELTKITSTRFIIVTHHALTMSKMDRLYGVTMPEKGISQLVAVDLQKAESMVA